MKSDSILNALKANWEFNVIVAAGFWLGILWRRTNRPAVWISMIASFAFFYVLSIFLPMVFPKLYYNDFLLQKTREQLIERVYTAHEMDVEQRHEDILRWELLVKEGKAKGQQPEAIEVGQEFVKLYKQPQRSIFWTQGITYEENGQAMGKGSLKMTLVCYQLLGFDLTENKYAFNETLKVLTKLAFPFILVIVVSYLVKRPRDEEEGLDRFYVKMKTPVSGDKEKDDKELALSYENPGRFDHLLLFPKTSWQFTRWDKTDAVGFSIAIAMIFAILGLLYFFVHLGGKIQL